MDLEDFRRILGPPCFQVDQDRYVLPRAGSFGWYINHSCKPNCVIRGERELVALQRITKGDELTFDYSTNVGWDGFAMECRCGSVNCRGTILSYGRLAVETKRRYGEMVSPFLLRTEGRSQAYSNRPFAVCLSFARSTAVPGAHSRGRDS